MNMVEWEYEIAYLPPGGTFRRRSDNSADERIDWEDEVKVMINGWGAMGWELVGVNNNVLFFKKQKEEQAR